MNRTTLWRFQNIQIVYIKLLTLINAVKEYSLGQVAWIKRSIRVESDTSQNGVKSA